MACNIYTQHGANVLGNANGTAAGVAPLAHLAIYKVCSSSSDGCFESDILAAMDAVIDDGVDVISISSGGRSTRFYEDNLALGAFSAVQKGISVICSAGNDGPAHTTLVNGAPWILTVGASTTDRSLRGTAVLGNNVEFNGESVFPLDSPPLPPQLPLLYPGMNGVLAASLCDAESLNDTSIVKGKIVLCRIESTRSRRTEQGQRVKDAGGTAMILMNMDYQGFTTSTDVYAIPATNVNYEDGLTILSYLNSTSTPTATIEFKGTITGDRKSPTVADFSARGPNYESQGILKPDVVGPGVNILAAWPNLAANNNTRSNYFEMISGTSVSCPHLSGVAALIKSAHPDWSPAAIKSAIMTSADVVDRENHPIMDEEHLPADAFAIGAGYVNPARASDPGLIYDIAPDDYIPYLCGLNYTSRKVSKILLRRAHCSAVPIIHEGQLNYPSFAIRLRSPSQTFTRTVTNVGVAVSSYNVEDVAPHGISMVVTPETLNFTRLNEKSTYEVSFRGSEYVGDTFDSRQGYILWKSAKHSVRIPIAAFHL
ncbi:PREDICTED: subtilisin-like protease SBT1.2 [Erythranthe guttata]|nr:PREDICTED: subtilisin-like protease SBT1.2 [Erythranthe guttata]|eukprot:XP_012847808.1 PREDICTED: subtilisin-like protease SBT1.2 [Erythranthe guttata]